MGKWKLVVTREAEADLSHLGSDIRHRVLQKIKWLQDNFEIITPLPLGGQWRGFFKLRVGDWRVVYQILIENQELVVHYIDRRDKIYKRVR